MSEMTTYLQRRPPVRARKLTADECSQRSIRSGYYVIDGKGVEHYVDAVAFDAQFEPARERAKPIEAANGEAPAAPAATEVDPSAARRAELQAELDALDSPVYRA